MAEHPTPRAILFDALGTLIDFENPVPRLQAALDVDEDAARRAIRAEITYYRAHLYEGRDRASLEDLRRRCAAAMAPELPGIDPAVLYDALMDALRFFAYPDSAPVLAALRERGIRRVVVSNWDASLHERLQETGIEVDGALASAELGVAKPARAIFAAALELAGTAPEETWHVGDTPDADVEGALGSGLRPVLIARAGDPPAVPAEVPVIRTLEQLLDLTL